MTHDPGENVELMRRAATDPAAWGQVLDHHRARLRRLIQFRMDPRLRARIDASDVIQETYLDASKRLPEFLDRPNMPFFLWLRFLARQRLAYLHRHHLGREIRDADREVHLHADSPSSYSSVLIATHLAHGHTPSESVVRHELQDRLRDALNQMDDIDREVLALRHFEGLSNNETAEALGLGVSAASKRYIRAAERLRDILIEFPELIAGR